MVDITHYLNDCKLILVSNREPYEHMRGANGIDVKQPAGGLVTALDPTLEDPFYVGPFVLRDSGLTDAANDLAAEGVRKNPDSARLHASFAQLLLTEKRIAEAREQADAALEGRWSDPTSEFDSLATLEIVFDKTGAKDKADWVRKERARIFPQVRAAQQQAGSD
jgi:hypothetical protein